ncbi:DUF3638 domain-containing protein [Legionella brunensis]|uniref:DUF3638 domain-containing protein n=1 Tax=Legionella brunensis TaxID=29422 RepID=A0A0W0SUM8_9GAMM|nr:DUF3638 domain-containing protein [Legionella brunensis]KTC87058.1 hypothetical protein Lbru_0287 [Legionella brunensis]
MARYTEEFVNLFSFVELQQIGSFIENLNIDDVKILRSVVLQKITDNDRRRVLQQFLTKREQQIREDPEKADALSEATQQNIGVNAQLEDLAKKFITKTLSNLTHDEAKKTFLELAKNEELFFLEYKLSTYHLEHEKAFHLALSAEIDRRKQENTWQESDNKIWQEQQGNPHWELDEWKKVIAKIDEVNLELRNKKPDPPPVEEPKKSQPSWLSKAWSDAKNFLFNAFVFFGFFDVKPKNKNPYKVEISAEEQKSIEEMRVHGAQRIANITEVSRVGELQEAQETTVENQTKKIMSRFGMVLASQMVAGTKSNNHGDLLNVIGSLTEPEDSDDKVNQINRAIKRVIPKEDNPLQGEHACAIGGVPFFVTALESEVVDKIVHSPEYFSQYGLHLSESERAQIELYQQNMERSRDLSNALYAVCTSWGGYEKDGQGYKKSEEFDKKQQAFEKRLKTASKALQQACAELEDGQSLYLETGLEKHAMQLVIKKVGNEFKLSTYDSSGALENTSLSQSFIGLIKLSRLRSSGAMRKNELSFSIPQERLISAKGLDYLSYLIRTKSPAGHAQTHIEHNLKSSSMEERSHMGWLRRVLALRQQSFKYAYYMEHFGSIASPDAPPKFGDLLQRPQNTQNCFAKKAQSCELYELGKSTYKKFRLATLLEQRDGLLKDIERGKGRFINDEYVPMLQGIEPEYLSPSELQEVSRRLCEVKEPPSKEYYQKYFKALLDAREKLAQVKNSNNQLAIQRIDAKIASHAKSYYLFLKQGKRQQEIEAIFSPAVSAKNSSFNWDSAVMPLKTDSSGKIEPHALEKLSEHAAAQAWKATIQLLNHQIKKLSVNERHIQSENERLPHASYRQASKKVTLHDLENANIVSFTEGFARKDNIKIEINIGGKQREIDKATFFKLVVKNKESLTNPKVIGLLDYLRNASPEIEARYVKEVYPTQRKTFEEKLKDSADKTEQSLQSAIKKLAVSQNRVFLMLKQARTNIRFIEKQIAEEKLDNPDRSSVRLRNLELRRDLLKSEQQEYEKLHTSVSTKIQYLQQLANVKGSPANKIAKARDLVDRLQGNHKDLQTINAVSHAFVQAQGELASAEETLDSKLKEFQVDIENGIANRDLLLNQSRQKIINNHLQTNAEYRILDDLSAGKMGTEKDRNPEMYQQSASKRAEFFKQGKNTFKPDSVFYKIQHLNQKLKTQVGEIVERKVILDTDFADASNLTSLASAKQEFIRMDKQAQEISQQPIPEEIKEVWVREMFKIWLQHTSPDLLYRIQKPNQSESALREGINHAFHHFIEQKANIKYAALKEAGYPIELTTEQMKNLGWKPISEQEIDTFHQERKKMASLILRRFKKVMGSTVSKPKEKTPALAPVQLNQRDLLAQHESFTKTNAFVLPNEVFLSQTAKEAMDGSTLTFLREHPMPHHEGESKAECERYFHEVKNYLHQLKRHSSLENKAQRINEFCHLSAAKIFNLPYPPPQELVLEIANTLIDHYRDDGNSIKDSFLKLENNERVQVLTALIKLSLSQIPGDESGKATVNSKFYSTIKQWERLIVPPDGAMSRKIAMLAPGGTEPKDITLFKEIDIALHESPVSLEGLYEGQKGLQIALTSYGQEKSGTGSDPRLRKLADRLGMRNGDALLAHQFLAYYSNPDLLLSTDGINSTQGRELFSRALLDAFQQATEVEKHELLNFLKALQFNEPRFNDSEWCNLYTPHQAFIEELLLRCANLSPKLFQNNTKYQDIYDTPKTMELITTFTDASNTEGSDRLLGFAKEVNLLSLKIKHELLQEPINTEVLDTLYAQLICANLAYQLILDQASEDVLDNLQTNFEYTREMSLAQTNINQLHEQLLEFSSQLAVNNRAELFNSVFSQYARDQKFDGPKVNISSPSSSDIPGFITLGGNKSLDVLHGVIYVGNSKLGVMPTYLQSHVALQELGLNNLPFKPQSGGFVYVEDNEVKASVIQLDGNLIVQRELRTLNGQAEMLQYISPEKMDSVPLALKSRLNAEHFFIDSKGNIHAYTSDFKPILQLSQQNGRWTGVLLDHHGLQTTINIDITGDFSMIEDLSRAFPQDELIRIDENSVYVPAIAKYVIQEKKGDYFVADNLTDKASRKHLKVTEQGSAFTEKELTDSEVNEVRLLTQKIQGLQKDLSLITHSDLLSQQAKNRIEKQIKQSESRIKEIKNPEYFVFVPDSEHVKALEKEHLKLRDAMQEAYVAYKEGGKDREQLTTHYEEAKKAYLQSKNTLHKAYATANHLRTFDVREDTVHAKDFQSILHVGLIPGKTTVLNQSLGANVPKSPLKPSELEALRNLKEHYQEKESPTMEERFAKLMLIGTELQHHLLEREASLSGKLSDWDRSAYPHLVAEFTKEVQQIQALSGVIPFNQFSELWRAIQSEFAADNELQRVFSKTITPVLTGEQKPININAKTSEMPIESIGGRPLVQFAGYKNPHALIDKEQIELEERLRSLGQFKASVDAQEEGYYYENYGLFNTNTLEKLFSITPEHTGLGGLTKAHVATLFKQMQDAKWIHPADGMANKYQLDRHPSEFYSPAKIAGYLAELGFERNQIRTISDRLQVFLYQTAVNGGRYSIDKSNRKELVQRVAEAQRKCNMAYLLALDKLTSTLEKASSEITFADLNSAYLLNDYSSILAYFPEKERSQIEIVLKNGTTRLLYHKTELDHLNDIQETFNMGQDSKALAMLHTRRNYQLDKLLESELPLDEKSTKEEVLKVEQEQKMQRAFLLFESEFGHRCNARQVSIFHGLLLDDKTDPDKIDAAQARMGFGKTSLLPLVALYKTGEKLVRFIVPKSALETNTADMSLTLTNILGRRAVKDDFQRYRIATDPESNMGEKSPRLKSLQDAKADLKKRLMLYQRVRENREVLVQAPSVRNSLECQAKIFLDLLLRASNEPLQQKELMECISLLNEIRSLETISVFDELDATQDPATTEVNYTAGEKIALDSTEIYPLEVITQTIKASEDKSVTHLATTLLQQFGINDDDHSLFNYITSLEVKQPASVTAANSTEIYLIRAILTNPVMLSIFTEKEPGTDFGVWFENAKDGSKLYDYEALRTGKDASSRTPLLIAIPYSAANTPKPQGSRFDNPEVTAITSLLYYLDPRTELNEQPHLEFLIDAFRKGIGETPFLNPSSGQLDPEFKTLVQEIKALAEIEDPLIRNEARKQYFATLEPRMKEGQIPPTAFRKMLARTVIQEQVKFDAGKANSNRYEQGTANDAVIGFSGTAGDTSSHFKVNMLDPAADGNMTLGIMGRKNCQATTPLNTTSFTQTGEDYTTALIKQLASSFSPNTRTLIDVGGLCKSSNRAVAKEIAMQLKSQASPLKGVIFYDDLTNMKKLLVLDSANKEKIVDLTPEMVSESDREGSYFTYYDQSHSRGADIKQMDGAHALLTLNFTVTNNDYKQAIMRMRKIVDKTSGQSFSTAVPDTVREKIISYLGLKKEHTLTGNDIAFWLRQRELESNLSNVSLLTMELDAVIKNAILQQQAELTKLMSPTLTETQVEAFRECIKALNNISPFISGSSTDLYAKYGKAYGHVKKEDFIRDLKTSFEKQLTTVFSEVNLARQKMNLPLATNQQPYLEMEQRIIQKREAQLSDEFIIPSASTMNESHSETENQSESQSESQNQTQTHSFSEVANEEVVVDAQLKKYDFPFEPVSMSYLSSSENMEQLPRASSIAHMSHLFNENDPVRCSPTYLLDEQLDLEHGNLTPPLQYFLAREEGNPKVILINQDEANRFKAAPVSPPWSLYDIRLKKEETLAPITGPAITSLKGSLLKKLYFSSYRYDVKLKSSNPAQSLEGIYTPEQLQPSLTIEFKSHAPQAGVPFKLPAWGFYGNKKQDIGLHIGRTNLSIKDKYEKKGVTISIGEGADRTEVFISAKLNKRILAEMPMDTESEISEKTPKLKQIKEQINQEYDAAMSKRTEFKKELASLKAKKKKVLEDYDKKIAELETKKNAAIGRAKASIDKSFGESMKDHLNRRKMHEDFLAKNVGAMCRLKIGDNKEFGIEVFGKTFAGIDKAITHCCNELYEENKKQALSPTELDKKLNAYIQAIAKATEERYQKVAQYKSKIFTPIESLYAAAQSSPPWPKNKLELALRKELQDIKRQWTDSKEKTDDKRHKKWNQFVSTIEEATNSSKGLPIDQFHQKVIDGLTKFAADNKMDANKLISVIMPRLCYSLSSAENIHAPPKVGFPVVDLPLDSSIVAVKEDINNFIKKGFLLATTTPSQEQSAFFASLHSHVKGKINNLDYKLPDVLLDHEKVPISPMAIMKAVKQVLVGQSIRTIDSEFISLCRESASFLVGRKAVENILDNYQPVENRSSKLDPVDGQEAQMFPSTYKALAKLDAEVLDIQRQIDEAKGLRKGDLATIQEKKAQLREQLKQLEENTLAELKAEKSAVNKLLSGIKNLWQVFARHQVALEKNEPIAFLESHFDLERIIRDDVSTSATLTFMPPEFYEIELDMQKQQLHMHGLDEAESKAKQSLDIATVIIRNDAEAIRLRECHVMHEFEHVYSIDEIESQQTLDNTTAITTTMTRDNIGILKRESHSLTENTVASKKLSKEGLITEASESLTEDSVSQKEDEAEKVEKSKKASTLFKQEVIKLKEDNTHDHTLVPK